MDKMTNKMIGELLLAILIPIAVGILSSSLSRAGMQLYKTIPKPTLAPPAVVFPIAWTTLYILMGVASYLVYSTSADSTIKKTACILYLVQLIMNFFWTIIFFNLQLYIVAYIWLVIMYATIIVCTIFFFLINPRAGWLMIPYNIWMAFAAYLNLAIVIKTN